MLEVGPAGVKEVRSSSFNEAALALMGIPAGGGPAPATRIAIGFADYGFDLLHPCLRNAAGDRSRFCFLWDQNQTPAPARTPDLDVTSVEDWDGGALDSAVREAAASGSRRALDARYDPHANNCGRNGTIGAAHGTMMASIAAGTAFAGFRSAAPDAALIGVQLALLDPDWKEEDAHGRPTWLDAPLPTDTTWPGWRSYDDAAQIGNAIRYIYDRACRIDVDALVINLSIGAWAGAHDDASAAERTIAQLAASADAAWAAGRGPRTIIVAGAGNAGADEGHWTGIVTRDAAQTFDWIMQRDDPTQNKLEIWYDANDPLDVGLGLPDGTTLNLTRDTTHEITIGAARIGIADHTIKARGSLSRLRLLLHPPLFPPKLFDSAAATTSFPVHLRAQRASAKAHAWIERDDGLRERSWLSPSHPENSLCCLASAGGALVVAGCDHRRQPVAGQPAILPQSSLGPSPWRDGVAGRVPHVTAPAAAIWGARSKSRGFAQTTGTSAAVALASGAIAYALARDPRTTLPPHALQMGWNSRFGFGLLSIDDNVATGGFA